jgi:glucans biosynthesis protein
MIDPSRRDIAWALATLAAMPGTALAQRGAKTSPFSWDMVQRRAQELAGRPYREPVKVAAAADIDYDAVGAITYRADRAIAGGIRLFPLGRYAPMPVKINVVDGGTATPVDFSADLFRTSKGHAPALGIAGFRAMSASGTSDWLAYMGASYFRSSGSQDQYGLSARGIAIDTGVPGKEEFPSFTEFWIERAGDQAYTIYALLDGASVTGAYRFQSRLGPTGAVQDVSSVLFLRRDIARLGIAPATSMFWYGEGNRQAAADWRPEIHDSDGLALLTGRGERIWRPLGNPPHETLDSFADENPRGFGLLQRDRTFDHYHDDGAFYDRRPNLWVEPQGQWGKGAVMLYAFPTATETVDNIVAFWNPAAPARAGQRLAYDYRLTWGSADPSAAAASAHAVDCWQGTAGAPGAAPIKGARKLVIDFLGSGLAGLDRSSGVTAQITVGQGKLLTSAAYPVVGQPNRWRITADIAPSGGAAPADVRLVLQRGTTALSETVLTQVFA